MFLPQAHKPIVPDHENTPMCRNHALFLHSLYPAIQFLGAILLAITSAVLTQMIRSITPGVGDKPNPPAPATATTMNSVECMAIPNPTVPVILTGEGEGGEGSPPPYQPPTIEATSLAATPVALTVQKVKRSSAHLFVLGTFAFLPLIFSLFCLALITQYWIFCNAWSPADTVTQVCFWVLYCIPALWATRGASCWAMLLRDLWGTKATKRWQFTETVLTTTLIAIVIAVPRGLFMAVGSSAIWAVESCQKRWCGDALADEEDGVDAVVVELQEGLRGEGGNGEGSVASTAEEENVGLIAGMEK